jgi:hypothetical protein
VVDRRHVAPLSPPFSPIVLFHRMSLRVVLSLKTACFQVFFEHLSPVMSVTGLATFRDTFANASPPGDSKNGARIP